MKPDWKKALPALFFVVLALIVFRAALPADQVIHSSDYNVGLIALYHSMFPADWFSGTWIGSVGLGSASYRAINLTNLFIALFPPTFVSGWVYAFHVIVASLALVAFLRRVGVSLAGAMCGALTAFWLGSNLTLAYPGHLYKFGVMTACALFLWLWEKALADRRPGWFVLAGGAFGLMFLEQQDLAVFCAVLVGPYALWRGLATWNATGRGPALPLRAVLAAVPALMLLSEAYFKARSSYIDPVAITQKSHEEKWGWATQWSWPPSETIDFVAPGFYGVRSDKPGAEYWGKMGRSPGWEETRQGFRNFKLESQYLGVLPVSLALFAMVLAFLRASKSAEQRGMLRFWTIACLLLFVLACGKYLPLYRAFYELPQMSSIRNPNKFLQPFQLALAVLAACGFDAVFSAARARFGVASRQAARWMAHAATAIAILLLLGWMTVHSSSATLAREIGTAGYSTPDALASAAASAMGHAFLMALLFAIIVRIALVTRFAEHPTVRRFLPYIAIAPLALDAILLSGNYLVPQHLGAIDKNPVAQFLREESGDRRVHALDQSGVYGHLLTFVFPYEGVNFTNLLAAPRVQSDMERYYRAAGRNLPRYWTHFGVSHVLMPATQWEQIRRAPPFNNLLEPAMGWGVVRDEKSGFRMVPMTENPQHVVLRLKNSPGRAWLVGAWKETDADTVFAALGTPSENSETVAWIEADASITAPLPASGESGMVGTVVTTRHQHRIEITASAPRPAFLVLSEPFGKHFRATVNGVETPLRRVNGVLMGLPVPEGEAKIEITYLMPKAGVRAVLFAFACCLIAAVSLARRSPHQRTSSPPA